jgi:hypothetical protein
MTEHKRNKLAYVLSLMFAGFVVTFFAWLFWPYPTITANGNAVLVNVPSDGVYKTGDVIRWTKTEVCQPAGKSTAEIWAVRVPAESEPQIILKTLMVHREFEVQDSAPDCVKDNPTSVYLFGSVPTGVYNFEVRVCMYNPTPQPNCTVFPGAQNVKIQRIAGNEPVIKP